MSRFWFPKLYPHSWVGCATGFGLFFAFSPEATAQVPPAQSSDGTQQFIHAGDINEQRFFPVAEGGRTEGFTSGDRLSGSAYRFTHYATIESPSLQTLLMAQEKESSDVSGQQPTLFFPPNPELAVAVETALKRSLPYEERYSFFPYGSGDLPDQAVGRDLGVEDDASFQVVISPESVELAQTNDVHSLTTDNTISQGAEERADLSPSLPDVENIDPELGLLRLRPLSNPETGRSSNASVLDPELGILRLREIPQTAEQPSKKKETVVFAQGNLGFFSGNNLLARTEALADTTLQSGLTLRSVPRIGPRTFVVGSAGGSVLRYADHGEFDYRELDLSLGVYHWLNRRTYVDVGWRNQQFFAEDGGDRFLNDHQARLAIGRADQLTSDLRLDSSYNLQASWSEPTERSRLINRFNVGLSHPISSTVDASVFYQLALIDFTQQDRYDSYHQFLVQLQFDLSEETTLTVFGGGRLGDSTHSLIDFDSTLFGLSLGMSFGLF